MSSNSDTTHVFHCTVLESEDVFPCGKEKQKGKGKEEKGKRKQKGKKKRKKGKAKKKEKKIMMGRGGEQGNWYWI